eukprot:Clim_evm3s87 gene=Clim_evmTU3s87
MAPAAAAAPAGGGQSKSRAGFTDRAKPAEVRSSNITAAKAVADAVRTSLGPKGMDKMIQDGRGEVTITNDGATIMKQMQVLHPAARMLVELSAAQDIEAGDGTTSVVVLAGSLLNACQRLLQKGIHPTTISDSFAFAAEEACKILKEMSVPVSLQDKETLIKSALTSLNSKVVSQYASTLGPIAVDAVLRVMDESNHIADLRNIKVVKKVGGTVDDTELIDGVCFTQKCCTNTTSAKNAKIALIQFCLSAPKTDMENQIVVSDYTQMDRVLREERNYILKLCKKIKESGANVVLIQKSILRDATTDLSIHFLNKLKIVAIKDVERDQIEFISKTLGCKPVASPDHLTADKLGFAESVEEVMEGDARLVKITGPKNPGRTITILCRGSNKLLLEESHRSIHDALCVIRCLVKQPYLIAGGGAPEIEISQRLLKLADTIQGMDQYCIRAFAEALEVIPYTLAENAGLNPISTVTELRNRHTKGERTAGINVRKGQISDILEENVLQPMLVTSSAITLAAETVRSIMKIDDIVASR